MLGSRWAAASCPPRLALPWHALLAFHILIFSCKRKGGWGVGTGGEGGGGHRELISLGSEQEKTLLKLVIPRDRNQLKAAKLMCSRMVFPPSPPRRGGCQRTWGWWQGPCLQQGQDPSAGAFAPSSGFTP